jgi:multicomponent Na+:H+ antiporter subunit C
MQLDTALLVGVLFGLSIYLILLRSFVQILFGFTLLSTSVNLFLLATSGSPDGKTVPIIGAGPNPVDPLPQALILTAIVIGFGVTAYLVVLLYRIFLDHDTIDAQDLFHPPKKTDDNSP